MGWWETREGLIGDAPVDLIEDVMFEWTEHDHPSWQELLNGIGTALLDRGRDWLSDPESLSHRRIRATFGPADAGLRSDPSAPRDRFHQMWTQAFEQVAEEYEQTQHRKPTLSEVLGTIAFSLRVAPERFVRNDQGWKLSAIDSVGGEERP
jgi:hypothetical protein